MTTPTVLSWTSSDPRESVMFSPWGVVYRFATEYLPGKVVTSLFRAARPGKEDRVARLEWDNSAGTLGKAVIGRATMPMADLIKKDSATTSAFNGPDGYQYRWRPSPTSSDLHLHDPVGNVIALYHPVRPAKRYSVGDVHGELHFFNAPVAVHPPLMDMVCLTAMLNRVVPQYTM